VPNAIAEAVIKRLTFEYPHAAMANRSATIAATNWAKSKGDQPATPSLEESGLKHTLSSTTLDLPRAIVGELELAATDRGTAAHLVLEHLDFKRSCTIEDVHEQISKMVNRKLLTQRQADVVDPDAIIWFVQSEVGSLIRSAQPEQVIREIPFNLAVVDNAISTAGGLDQVMLRGRIDLMVRTGNGCVVIDYKTDNVSGDQIKRRKDSYRQQVQLYRDAIQKLTGIPVDDVILVFLSAREVCHV
jgi:ATP-dependent helicase/nuclease subunit A